MVQTTVAAIVPLLGTLAFTYDDGEHNACKTPGTEPAHKELTLGAHHPIPARVENTGNIRIRVRLKMAYSRMSQLK